MYGSPIKLSTEPAKLFADDSTGFGIPQGNEIFYTIKDGDWDDVSVWQTVSGRMGKLPGKDDSVYINHSITYTNTTTNFYINNITISGELNFSVVPRIAIYILGIIHCTGTLSQSGINTFLFLYSESNFINKESCIGMNFVYAKTYGIQYVLDLNYHHLFFVNHSQKILQSDIITTGDFGFPTIGYGAIPVFNLLNIYTTNNGYIDYKNFNILIGGKTIMGMFTTKSDFNGDVIFVDQMRVFVNVALSNYGAGYKVNDFRDSNPDFEFRGGIYLEGYNPLSTGTGTWRFTTNNQDMYGYTNASAGTVVMDCLILIDDITLSITTSPSFPLSRHLFRFDNGANGTTAESVLKITQSNGILFATPESLNIMSVGQFDYMSSAVDSMMRYELECDLHYDVYSSLYTTEFCKLIGDTTVKNFGGKIDLNGYVLTITEGVVNPSNIITTTTNGTIHIKNGKAIFENYIYTGILSINLESTAILEFRNGGKIGSAGNYVTSVGSVILLSSNNQNLIIGGSVTANNNLTVDNIEATLINSGTGFMLVIGEINALGTSTLIVDSSMVIRYQNALEPFASGSLQCNTGSTFIYNRSGNQDIKGTTYYNLELGGSGVKKLMGNVVVTGTYTLSGTATLDLNGFTLTT